MITYPFPITANVIAHLRLPQYLSHKDADRICRMLHSVAVPDGFLAWQRVRAEPYRLRLTGSNGVSRSETKSTRKEDE